MGKGLGTPTEGYEGDGEDVEEGSVMEQLVRSVKRELTQAAADPSRHPMLNIESAIFNSGMNLQMQDFLLTMLLADPWLEENAIVVLRTRGGSMRMAFGLSRDRELWQREGGKRHLGADEVSCYTVGQFLAGLRFAMEQGGGQLAN